MRLKLATEERLREFTKDPVLQQLGFSRWNDYKPNLFVILLSHNSYGDNWHCLTELLTLEPGHYLGNDRACDKDVLK